MPELINGLGYIARREMVDGHEAFVVRCSLPRLYVSNDTAVTDSALPWITIPRDMDSYIWADELILVGQIAAPGRKLHFSARAIGLQADVTIDVSGSPHQPATLLAPNASDEFQERARDGDPYKPSWWRQFVAPTAPTRGTDGAHAQKIAWAGNNGAKGGNVTLLFDHEIGSPNHLRIDVNGAPGQGGQQGYRGQDGGHGGRGLVSANTKSGGGFVDPDVTLASARGGNGGNGFAGGQGGDGGKGGSVEIYTIAPLQTIALAIDLKAAPGGKGGAGGAGGIAGQTPDEEREWDAPVDKHPPKEYASPGSPGATANDGAAGSLGSSLFWPNLPPGFFLERWDVSHLDMLLQRAKQEYVNAGFVRADGDLSGVEKADLRALRQGTIELLLWLFGTLNAIQESSVASNIRSRSATSVRIIEGLRQECGALVRNLHEGRDAFGHRPSFVPAVSLEYLKGRVNALLESCDRLEREHRSAFASFSENQKAVINASSLAETARANLAAGKQVVADLERALSETEREIRPLQSAAEDALSDLAKSIDDDVLAHLRSRYDALMDPQSYIRALEMVAFCPPISASGLSGSGVAMLIAQGSSIAWDGLTKLEDSHGVKIAKDLAIRKVSQASDSAIGDAITVLRHTPTEAQATRVLGRLEDLETEVDGLRALSPEFKNTLRRALNATTSTTMKRLEYAAILGRIAQTIADNVRMEASLDENLREASEGRPTAVAPLLAFYSTMVRRQRELIQYELSLADRAYRAWSLSVAPPLFAQALNDSSGWAANDISWGVTTSVLRAVADTLENRIDDAIRSHSANSQIFSTVGHEALIIKDPLALDVFKRRKRLEVEIVRDDGRAGTFQAPGFRGKFDIRIADVEVYLSGATSEMRIPINVRHGQTDTFYPRAGSSVYCSYDRLEPLQYFFSPGTTPAETGRRAIDAGPYAMRGPFTRWSIELPADVIRSVDLAGLHTITMVFHGTFRA